MKVLTVVFSDWTRARYVDEPPTHRSVQIELTEEQLRQLARRHEDEVLVMTFIEERLTGETGCRRCSLICTDRDCGHRHDQHNSSDAVLYCNECRESCSGEFTEGPLFQLQGWRDGEVVALVQDYAGGDLHAAAVDARSKLGDGPFDDVIFTVDPDRFAMTDVERR